MKTKVKSQSGKVHWADSIAERYGSKIAFTPCQWSYGIVVELADPAAEVTCKICLKAKGETK